MTEQWQELKETITEMRDNDGTLTQQEVCKFLANYMDTLEKQITDEWIRCSERLPEPQKDRDKDFSDWVQVTINLGENNNVTSEAYYCFSNNKWYTERFVIGEVIAWMPKPHPYSESEDKQ